MNYNFSARALNCRDSLLPPRVFCPNPTMLSGGRQDRPGNRCTHESKRFHDLLESNTCASAVWYIRPTPGT